jgi:hypothetical protein
MVADCSIFLLYFFFVLLSSPKHVQQDTFYTFGTYLLYFRDFYAFYL